MKFTSSHCTAILSVLLSFFSTPGLKANIDTVLVTNNVFTPNALTLTAGDTVTWINMTGSHNVNGTQAMYPSNPESFGNSVGTGWTYTHVFAIPGGYDYRCDPHFLLGMTGTLTVLPPPDPVYINEIHYDNTGGDIGEGVEVAGPAGIDLSCYTLNFYNGSDSLQYAASALSGLIPDKGCGYGVVWFPVAGIQNGSPDAIALNNTCNTNVVQFLSYEGVLTALDGPAVGLTSVDIGVSEPTSAPVGASLQLTGTGTVYNDFTWAGPLTATPDQINSGQNVCPGDTIISFSGSGMSVAEDTGTISIQLTIVNPSPVTAFTVEVAYSSGTATLSSDFTFTTQVITFPPADSSNQTATLTIIDDAIPENYESIVLILQNPSPGISLGSDSVFTIVIKGNDVVLSPCSDLFFSEYVEGSSFNKALEVYNPLTDTVNLANYTFARRNGGLTTVSTYVYSGLLLPGDVFVVVNSSADSLNLLPLGDTTSALTSFNGNDALALVNILTGDTIDKFGEWGVDPGTNWTVGSGATSEYTLVRKTTVQQGQLYWASGAGEWDVYPQDDFSHLGNHSMTSCNTPAIVAGFSSNSPVCLNDSVCFTDLSVAGGGAIASWFWDFGDGNNSTSQNPCHIYAGAATYTVTLIVIDDSSYTDTASATVSVNPAISVDAGIDQIVCPDMACIALSGVVSGPTTTGTWTTSGTGVFIPDATALNSCYSPSAADTATGSVIIVLTSTNNGNCTAVIDTTVITFNAIPGIDISAVVVDSSSCGNSDGNVSGITASGTAPLTYSWVNGASATVGGSADLLLVPADCYTLTVTDGNGCSRSSGPHCVNNAGTPGVPVAGGGGSYCDGDSIADLTATGSGGTLYWFSDALLTDTIGTGSPFATGTTVSDTFYVAEMGACLGLPAQVIILVSPAASVDAGPDGSICEGDTYVLSGSIAGSAASSTWSTSGSGTFDDSSLTNATYTPGAADVSAGSVMLLFTTDDPAGSCPAAVDTLMLSISQLASCNAGADATVCAGDVLQLNGIIGGSAVSATWSSSGDGAFDDNTSLTATYTPGTADITAGSVTLTLTTDDPPGACLPATDAVNAVIAPVPAAAFTATSTDLSVAFTDASAIASGSITSWSWDFGDGNSSISQNPANVYAADGTYNVCLAVTSSMGCTDTFCDSITVTSVGLADRDIEHDLEVFPNPSDDGRITVKLSAAFHAGVRLSVYNMFGELIIFQTMNTPGSGTVDLSGCSAGIYVINITTGQGSISRKVTIF